MALNIEDLKYEYVKKDIDENLICKICTMPLINPVSTCKTKDHIYCRICIENHITNKSFCPVCQQKIRAEDLKAYDETIFNKMLNNLPVKCLNCNEPQMKRVDYDHHFNEKCPKTIVPCLASDICPWKGTRDQLEDHWENCILKEFKPVIDALGLYIKQSENEKHQLRSQCQIFKDKSNQLTNSTNKSRNSIVRPMKGDHSLSNETNYTQVETEESEKFDKEYNGSDLAYELKLFIGKLSTKYQVQIEVVTKENQKQKDDINRLQTQLKTLQQDHQLSKTQYEKLLSQFSTGQNFKKEEERSYAHRALSNHDQPRSTTSHSLPSATFNPAPSPAYCAHQAANNNYPIRSNSVNEQSNTTTISWNTDTLNIANHRTNIPITINANIANGDNIITIGNNHNICTGNYTIHGNNNNNVVGGKNHTFSGRNRNINRDNNAENNHNNNDDTVNRVGNANPAAINNPTITITNNPSCINYAGGDNIIPSGNDNNIVTGNYNIGGNNNNNNNNNVVGGYSHVFGNNDDNNPRNTNDRDRIDLECRSHTSEHHPSDDLGSETASINENIRENPDYVHPTSGNSHNNN